MKSLTATLLVLTVAVCLAEIEFEIDERGSGADIYRAIMSEGKYRII